MAQRQSADRGVAGVMDWREGLATYLAERLQSADGVRIGRIGSMPAGASNQTIAVDLEVACDGETITVPLVLRPQRQAGILSPYDVGRQFRIMRALARSDVPVPPVAWHEPDGALLGTPFYLMYRLRADTMPLIWYGRQTRRLLAAAAGLARVHQVDWRAAGLDFLLPGEGALPSPMACELAAWQARAERSGTVRAPLVGALERFLIENEPGDTRHSLVHGDTNAGNYLFRGDELAAIVDWELSAIGDGRSDLGFYAALSELFGGEEAEGGRSALSEAYEAATGTRLTHLPYFMAFGIYRLLIVMSGWGGFYGSGAIVRRLDELLGPNWAA